MLRGLTYSRSDWPESRSPLANGVAPCQVPHLSTDPRSLTSSLMNVGALFAGGRSSTASARGLGWFSCSMNHQTYRTSQPGLWWNCTPIPCTAGVIVGHVATSPWPIKRVAGASPPFPPRDRAIVKAIACEAVCQTKLPLSRLSTSDLADKASTDLGRPISPSTVWRILDTDAIKPWRYQYWIFPRDPKFSEKAGRVLDLYAGSWEGKPLGRRDYIISSDEKTSIQARIRCHKSLPTGPRRPMRVEHEYERGGALQYLAAWDVRRGRVLGRCEDKTGIDSFGRLVEQVMRSEPYRSASRVFLGRGQRLLSPRSNSDPATAEGLSQGGSGPYARPCQLAESGRDLFFDHPKEGVDPERLRQLGRSRAATAVVRRTEQSRAATIPMEV